MNVYIRSIKLTKLPETEIEYTAYQGFSALGFDPVFFETEEEIKDSRQDDLIVGGVSYFGALIVVMHNDYVNELIIQVKDRIKSVMRMS